MKNGKYCSSQCSLTAAVCFWLSPFLLIPALGRDDAKIRSAIDNYNAGVQAYNAQRLDQAADLFLASYNACPDPVVEYYLSSTYFELNNFTEAKKFAEIVLRATPRLPESDRSQMQQILTWIDHRSGGGSVSAKADDTSVPRNATPKPKARPPSGMLVLRTVTKGNLLWYRDAKRDGTGEVANPSTIGHGGWQVFRNVFSDGNGIIYAITQEGNLLWYEDTKRNGTGEVANPKVIGHGGWQTFKDVFSGGDGIIYATTQQGDLLWYKDSKRNGTGEIANPKIIGHGGWQGFKTVFSGGNGIIYAITQQGDLLWYRDLKRDGTGAVANPKVIGHGGWQLFKSVFSGGDGIIYAITQQGDLLWYKDFRRDGTGAVANPKVIGRGGWHLFKEVFSGGQGIIYAISSDSSA